MTEPADDGRPWEVRKTFMEHLLELRSRILVSLFFVLAATIASWVFWKELGAIITKPVHDYNAVAPEPARVELITTGPFEAFTAVLHLGLWAGLALAFPVVAWQTWRFVAPGLYRSERLALVPILTMGTVFFAGGVWFAYSFVVPIGMAYLLSFAPDLGVRSKLALGEYMHFFVMVLVAFGITFETPLVILALGRLGLVTARGLVRAWRYVTVGAFVIGAILTPPDVLTQFLMAGSLLVLYILSIVLVWVFGRRRLVEEPGKSAAPQEPGPGPAAGGSQ